MQQCTVLIVIVLVAAAGASPQGYGAPPPVAAPVGQGLASPPAGGYSSTNNVGGGRLLGSAGGFGPQAVGAGLGGGNRGGFVSGGGGGFVDEFAGQGMPYNFDWAVREPDYGNDFDHQEQSDGVVTSGQYRVNLPDGRVQIVTYTVQGDSGYQATVTYEGEAQYPPQDFSRQIAGSGRVNQYSGRPSGNIGLGSQAGNIGIVPQPAGGYQAAPAGNFQGNFDQNARGVNSAPATPSQSYGGF